jgi:hypothetical protein
MLKPVIVIMDVHVISMGFRPTDSVELLYYFIFAQETMVIQVLTEFDVISAISWPKAIHEGNGTAQLFISKNNTNNEQRNAIISIFSGQAKGEGPFALFAGTIKFFLEPQFVDILVKIDGKKSSFSVPGIIDVQSESFVNPVTGEEQDTRIQLPKGFIWKLAEMAKAKVMRITTPHLNYDHSGKNALYSVIEYKGP